MVAEPAEATTTEEVIQQPDAEPIQADESTLAEQESPQPSDDIDAFLKERGLAVEEETAEPAGEESEAEDAWLNELNPEHKEKVEALLQQDKAVKESQKRAQTEGRRRAFQNYRAWVEKTARDDGASEDAIKRLTDSVTQYHDYSTQFAQEEVAESFAKGMYEYASKYLPTSERDGFKNKQHENNDAFFKELVEVSRKGYVSESNAKKEAAEAVKGYKAWLQADTNRIQALMSSAKAPELNGSGVSSGRSFASAADADAAFNRNEIDADTWKRETDRLRGSSRSQ